MTVKYDETSYELTLIDECGIFHPVCSTYDFCINDSFEGERREFGCFTKLLYFFFITLTAVIWLPLFYCLIYMPIKMNTIAARIYCFCLCINPNNPPEHVCALLLFPIIIVCYFFGVVWYLLISIINLPFVLIAPFYFTCCKK